MGMIWWMEVRGEHVWPWRACGGACSSKRAAREEGRRGNGENRPGLRILLPKTCKSDTVASLRAHKQPRGDRNLVSVGHDFN
jgi:hypothetical protein